MADTKIIEEVFKAIDIITDKKLYLTEYVYTEDCIIVSKTNDVSLYKVLHQGQEYDAYAPLGEVYSLNQNVVVLFTDYSRITKKIILYGKNSNSSYNKKLSDLGIANTLTIEASPYIYNGITYGTVTPTILYTADPNAASADDEYFYYNATIGMKNPIEKDSSYYWPAMIFHGSFYGKNSSYKGYPFVQFVQGAYMGFPQNFTYDPISDGIKATCFNNYGNVKIFNTSNSALDLGIGTYNGDITKYYYNDGAGYLIKLGSIGMTGLGIQLLSNSDYRLKEDIQTLNNGLSKIKLLNPVTWTWKNTNSIGEGFLAHEAAEVIPVAVSGEKDKVDSDGRPVYQQMDLSKLIPTLVSAVKELSAEVEALKVEISNLKKGS